MKTFQKTIIEHEQVSGIELDFTPDLILVFFSPDYLQITETISLINNRFPNAIITGCSTSGEIHDIKVSDRTVVFNAIKFEKTEIKKAAKNIKDFDNSFDAGLSLFKNLYQEDLKHVVLLSDGLMVKGEELIAGITELMPKHITVTGGLAGDGPNFEQTFIINQNSIASGQMVAIGFYGDHIKVGYSSNGGWDSFGIERKVTKATQNILYELDGQPALSLYKSFLGNKAEGLPATGLLFPLSMRATQDKKPVVRTILSIDEKENSLIFAGSIPEGSYVRLMKANQDRLINGAEDSAKTANKSFPANAEFALLISCVGRRLVLNQIVEEEIEAVREVLGKETAITGFYSYGEIAPFEKGEDCELHNQTMTITTFTESL